MPPPSSFTTLTSSPLSIFSSKKMAFGPNSMLSFFYFESIAAAFF